MPISESSRHGWNPNYAKSSPTTNTTTGSSTSSSNDHQEGHDVAMTPKTQNYNNKRRQRQQPRRYTEQQLRDKRPGRATSRKRRKIDRSKLDDTKSKGSIQPSTSHSGNSCHNKNNNNNEEEEEPKVFFGEYWEIEKVLAVRERVVWIGPRKNSKSKKGTKILQFLIQWKGSQYENTWEPEENLCDTALLEARKLVEERMQMKRREQLGLRKLPPTQLHDSNVPTTTTMDITRTTNSMPATAPLDDDDDEDDDDDSSLGGISILTASVLGDTEDDNVILETIRLVDSLKRDDLYETSEQELEMPQDELHNTSEGEELQEPEQNVIEDINFNWMTDQVLNTMEIERVSVLDPKCSEKLTMSRSMGIPIVLTDHKGFPQFASRWLSLVEPQQPQEHTNEENVSLPHQPLQYESIISYDSVATLTTTTAETTIDTKAKDDDEIRSNTSSAYCKVLDRVNPKQKAKKNTFTEEHKNNSFIDLTSSNHEMHAVYDDVITITSSNSVDEVNSVELLLTISNNSENHTFASADFDASDVEVLDRQKNDAEIEDKKIAGRCVSNRAKMPKTGESTAENDDWIIPFFTDDSMDVAKSTSTKKLPELCTSEEKAVDRAMIATEERSVARTQENATSSVNENSIPPFTSDDIANTNDAISPMLDLTLPYKVDVAVMVQDIGNEMVPILRKKYNDENPINLYMSVRRFLRDNWPNNNTMEGGSVIASSRKTPSLYLHQWLFTSSPTAVPKLCNHVNILPYDILGEDLLRYWYNKERCDGDSPYQYIFMGDTDTLSRLHKDDGGLDIFIAPIVGQKEVKLVHRADGVTSLYSLDACIDRPDLDEYPMLFSARIWKSVIKPGEILVMPQGTYHQCRNITPCLSYHRFHLDTLNLTAFYESWKEKDAPDIDHEEVIWNAATELCRKVDAFVEGVRRCHDHFVPAEILSAVKSLRALRNVCKEISMQLTSDDDWKLIVQDVEETLHEFRYRLSEKIPAIKK